MRGIDSCHSLLFHAVFSLLYSMAYICIPDFFSENRLKTIWHEFWLFIYQKAIKLTNLMKEKEGSVSFVLGVLGMALILIVTILLLP